MPFLPGTSLEPAVIPTAHASSFTLQYLSHIMCDIPSIAVFCSESIECFPGTASKFSLKLLVTIPVAQIITGIIVNFGFHIRCISILLLLLLLLLGFCSYFLLQCFCQLHNFSSVCHSTRFKNLPLFPVKLSIIRACFSFSYINLSSSCLSVSAFLFTITLYFFCFCFSCWAHSMLVSLSSFS